MERHELRLSNEIIKTFKNSKANNQERKPKNQQRRLELPYELKKAMQDRQWKCAEIKEDLESIRKFSILNVIRERVFDVLSELPLLSIEYLCQQDIDGLIRRNLLRERKVRFSADNEYEGEEKISKSEEEMEKENILEEMDIVLKVLGSDKRNRLVIENFELLEERIARVEQRLSGLIRKLPVKNVGTEFVQSQIKIDVEHVRMDIENFVNKFNEVFSSDFEITTSAVDTLDHAQHSVSSTNRLRFQMLLRLPDMSPIDALQESNSTSEDASNNQQATANNEDSNGVASFDLEREESKTNRNDLKAVDSLISLRERFKAQSVKWLQISSENAQYAKNEPLVEVTETFLSKENAVAKQIVETEHANEYAEFNVYPPIRIPEMSDDAKSMASVEPTLQDTSEITKELNKSIKEHKSVQTAPKKKKQKSKTKTETQKSQQIVDGKEVWVQYVNKKVLRYSKSSLHVNEPNMQGKVAKIVKEKPKQERVQKQPKLPKIYKPSSNIKENKGIKTIQKDVQKAEIKKSEQSPEKDKFQKEEVSTQFKEYKKIFLLKIPKNHSKLNCTNPLNAQLKPPLRKTESKLLTALKDTNACKKVTEKTSKTKSLIRLFPKAFKPKPKEQKLTKKQETSTNSTTKLTTSVDSLQKMNANQFLYKIRNRWIYEADPQGRFIKKNLNDLPQMLQKNNAKNRKLTQKLKKKKSEVK